MLPLINIRPFQTLSLLDLHPIGITLVTGMCLETELSKPYCKIQGKWQVMSILQRFWTSGSFKFFGKVECRSNQVPGVEYLLITMLLLVSHQICLQLSSYSTLIEVCIYHSWPYYKPLIIFIFGLAKLPW